jgi:hypothetical protein
LKFKNILIDVVNFFYRIKTNEIPKKLQSDYVYKDSIVNFIDSVNQLKEKYLHADGHIFLLLDNVDSRDELQSSFYFVKRKTLYDSYKKNRRKEKKEFYNSLNFLKYYYLLNDKCFKIIQVAQLEADDLVKPILKEYSTEKSNSLMITNDLDWTRYLSNNVYWLPKMDKEPMNSKDFVSTRNFEPSEFNVIFYKSIFGDPSDNIPEIIKEDKETFNEFLSIIKECRSITDLNTFRIRDKNVKDLKIIKAISAYEAQFKINLQLTSSIPVSPEFLKSVTSTGRQATKMTEVLDKALGLKKDDSKFVFGKVKRPRG